MSKFDRQLDGLVGQGRVEIQIAEGERVDVGKLHQLLRNEIDTHEHRIHLDLRKVHGAPEALVDVVIESQEYAHTQGKILSISYALQPMRDALEPRRRRKPGESNESAKREADASKVARELIGHSIADVMVNEIDNTEKIQRGKKTKKKTSRIRKFVVLGSVILVFAMVVAAVEWVVVFSDQPDAVIIPSKTFE